MKKILRIYGRWILFNGRVNFQSLKFLNASSETIQKNLDAATSGMMRHGPKTALECTHDSSLKRTYNSLEHVSFSSACAKSFIMTSSSNPGSSAASTNTSLFETCFAQGLDISEFGGTNDPTIKQLAAATTSFAARLLQQRAEEALERQRLERDEVVMRQVIQKRSQELQQAAAAAAAAVHKNVMTHHDKESARPNETMDLNDALVSMHRHDHAATTPTVSNSSRRKFRRQDKQQQQQQLVKNSCSARSSSTTSSSSSSSIPQRKKGHNNDRKAVVMAVPKKSRKAKY
jgi:hypothetical protein